MSSGSPGFLILGLAYVAVFVVAAWQSAEVLRLWMCQQNVLASVELTLVMLCSLARAINMFLYYALSSGELSLAVAAFISGFPLILNGYIFCLIVLSWCAVDGRDCISCFDFNTGPRWCTARATR